MKCTFAVLGLLTILSPTSLQGAGPLVGQVADFSLQDSLGATHALNDWRDKKLVVVAFLGTECPLAKLYGRRLAELADKYPGVQFIGINSNQQDTLREITHYAKIHHIEFPILKDPAHEVADLFAAQRTPMVFVLDQNHRIRYRGRVDDQYGVGTSRSEATVHFLADAIDELLSDRPVSVPMTDAVGCFISRVEKVAPTGDITYANQISRLMQKHCVRCHREGQIAPFTLTDYEETSAWAETMLEVMDDGRMPPWHANPEFGHFANDAQMTPAEKQLFRQWFENGMPKGDASQLPPPLKFTEGWQIAKPDKVYSMPEPFAVPAKGIVDYQYFVLDPEFEEDVWVKAAEVRPGNYAVVHHAIAFFSLPEKKFRGEDVLYKSIASYAPGMPAIVWPKGLARRIPAGSKIVFQMHYTPNGSEQMDQTEVGIVFADSKKVEKEIKYVIAANSKFRIPPEDANYHVPATIKFPQEMLLHTMIPHMHLRGKSFRFTARYPDGKEEILLDVPHYDFNWQNAYALAEPKLIPAGTIMMCDAHYDNSEGNPTNPDSSKEIHWGDQSWDEMMIGSMITTLPDSQPEDNHKDR